MTRGRVKQRYRYLRDHLGYWRVYDGDRFLGRAWHPWKAPRSWACATGDEVVPVKGQLFNSREDCARELAERTP
jgi:hypothetical protein